MKHFATPDRLLALSCIVLAIAILLLWIPNDIETGLIEKRRRQLRIGDAMLPMLALGFVLVGALLTLVLRHDGDMYLRAQNLTYLAMLLGVLAVALLTMRWLGPAVVVAVGDEADYRALRDTIPWKYLGFLSGGTLLVAGLMTLMEGRLRWRSVLIGLAASAALIFLYDVPFQDLLLPPNGDV